MIYNVFSNDNLYICITGFHAYEKEGMGPRKFGKFLLLFLRQTETETERERQRERQTDRQTD